MTSIHCTTHGTSFRAQVQNYTLKKQYTRALTFQNLVPQVGQAAEGKCRLLSLIRALTLMECASFSAVLGSRKKRWWR
jgi:hypothetical protein